MSLTDIVDPNLVQAVGWALVHLLWQATLVAAVLAVVLALLRRQAAAVRYVVACGALVLVMALPVLTIWNRYHPEVKLGGADSEQSTSGTPTGSFPLLELQAPSTTVLTGNGSASPVFSYHQFLVQLNRYLPLLVSLWMLGVVWSSGRLLVAWMRLRRLALHGAAASPQWQHALARLTRRIRLSRPVRLLESAMVEVPTVIGWLRPVVLLPVSALTGMSRQQLEIILAHELAHIRRHDFIVNILQTAVETLFFYHPAVWWISAQIRVEREHCCDDLAVELCGDPLLYARALADLEQTRFPSPSPALALSGGSLLQRVRRLISDAPRKCSAQWLAGVSILTIVASLALAAPLSILALHDDEAQPAKKEQKQAPAKIAPTPVPSATVTVTAPRAREEEDECDEEWCDELEMDHDAMAVAAADALEQAAIAQRVAARVAANSPAIVATANSISTQVPLISARVSSLLATSFADGFAHALATPQATPRPPRPAKAPKPPRVHALNDLDIDLEPDIDFDFDFDFDFDYDFEFEPDGTPAPPRAEKSERDKPLNRAALTVDDLIRLKALGISPEYIEELERAGYRDLSLNDLARLRAAGVRGSDVAEFRSFGLTDLSARDLARLKAAGVTADYVREIRNAGYSEVSVRDLARLRAAGVSGSFITEANSVAGKKLTVRELLQMKHTGIDRKFIEELGRSGFSGLTPAELVRWKTLGVTPEFAREMKAAGLTNVSASELIMLRAANVTADYVRTLREAGLTNLTAKEVLKLRRAGVDAEFIRQMKK